MSFRSEWAIGREGFTLDTVLSALKKTALNPYLTLPLYAASLYTEKGWNIVSERPRLASWLKRFVVLSAIRALNNTLNSATVNNLSNDTYDWSKEIVVITGGSDGIGAKVVQLLAERGITVVILDIQPPKFPVTPNIHFYQCDISSPSAIRYIAGGISQQIGNPTILINNAGFARGNSILTASETDIKLTFQINTIAHYHLAQAFLPSMIKHNHGMIVTVASLAAYISAPNMIDYAASKSAALAFHEGLAAELATTHKAPRIRAVAICQGYTRTALFDGFHAGDGFANYALDAGTVAEEVARAVLRGRSDHIVLPRNEAWLANVRGWPLWMQAALRKRSVKLMRQWNGRQVAQPSETKAVEKVEKLEQAPPSGVEASGVLVNKD